MKTCLTAFSDCDNDVFTLWAKFLRMCRYCIDTFVPNKARKVSKQTPWMTRNILQLKRKIKRSKRTLAQPQIISVISVIQNKLASAFENSNDYLFTTVLRSFVKST